MHINEIRELQPYSEQQLKELFRTSGELFDKQVSNLIKQGLLRRISTKADPLELELLLDLDDSSDIETYDQMYIFKYVGIIIVYDVCLFIYPKYINHESITEDVKNDYAKFKQVLEVIRKYNAKQQDLALTGETDSRNFNLLSFTMDLLDNYHRNGLYTNDVAIIEENGEGEILWDKTINEQQAYFSNGIPYYLDVYTMNTMSDENNIFRKLHGVILTTVCRQLESILNILNIPKVMIEELEVEDLGTVDYLTYSIKKEQSQQFVTWKQSVLKSMLAYLLREDAKKGIESITFVGTNSFHTIWEDVCSNVLNNSLTKTLDSLGVTAPEDNENPIKGSNTLKEFIVRPKWKHHESEKVHKAPQTLIPDLIVIKDKEMYIYDAKYYSIILDGNRVAKQPGVGDVSKQYLYELAYKPLIEHNGLSVKCNQFLMPTDGEEDEVIGLAKFDIFHYLALDKPLKDIEIKLLSATKLYQEYL